jgi:hypothetical protein
MGPSTMDQFTYQMDDKEIRRDADVLKVQTVFPAELYKSKPTTRQMRELVEEAEKLGYTRGKCKCFLPGENTHDSLYNIFISRQIPDDLDALIKQLAQHWQPSGQIIEADHVVQQLPTEKAESEE